jgi:hypothetical protein
LELKKQVSGCVEKDDTKCCGSKEYNLKTHYCGEDLITDEQGISHRKDIPIEKLDSGRKCFSVNWCKSGKCAKTNTSSRIATCQ